MTRDNRDTHGGRRETIRACGSPKDGPMSGLATEDRLANVPRQVREAMEASSAKVASLNPAPGNDAPVAAPEATAATPETPAPAPPPETQPTQQAQQTPAPAPPTDEWRTRYESLEQVYRTQEGRLRKANEELNRLKAQVEVLERVGHKPGDQATATATDEDLALARQLLSEEELDYGDDIPRMVVKLARAEVDRRMQQQPKAQSQEAQGEAAPLSRAFWDGLAQLVPDFQVIDRDPGFLAWLRAPDGLSHRMRQELLMEARDAEDPVGVARIFQAYKDSARPKTNPHPTVQEQVAPATAPGMPGRTDTAKTYTLEEWREGMKRSTQDGNLTTPQKEELRREYRNAAREGRVQGLPAQQ